MSDSPRFRPRAAPPKPGFTQLAGVGGSSGFVPDPRFGTPATPNEPQDEPPPASGEDAPDPLVQAHAQGHAEGLRQGREEAQARAEADAEAFAALDIGFARLDEALEEELRLRLRETVAALCEFAIAPLAIDEDALLHRIAVAVSMLARADDERVIRLHPQDIALLSPRLRADWHVQPDSHLERGTVRVESAMGGIEDGPATWRLAIAEALRQC